MRATGWIFMLGSLAFVWGLALWCYTRVFRGGGASRDSGPGDES